MAPRGDVAPRGHAYARDMSLVRVLLLPLRGLWLLLRGVTAPLRRFARGVVWLAGWTAGSREPEARARRRVAFTVLAWLAAGVFWAIAFGTAQISYEISLGIAPFVGAVAGLPFALVTSRPVTAWALSAAGAFLLPNLLTPTNAVPWPWGVMHGLVTLALLFAVCVTQSWGRAVGAWLVTVALWLWGVPGEQVAGWMVGVTVVAIVGVLAGRLARARRALAEQAELSEAEKARRVVLEERTRIARDLHDIVAHHMSLVVVQAETAPYRVADLSDAARAELDSISTSARSALAETRALLAVLRQEGDAAEHAPQPGVGDLGPLLDGARRAGVPLTADVRVPEGALRPGTSLAAYRIVQEALANASRHAAGAAVRASVVHEGDHLRVTVVNGPVPGGLPWDPTGGQPVREGHGLTGMRERVGAEGGTLWAGLTSEGGFAVDATLPLSPDSQPQPSGVGGPAADAGPPARVETPEGAEGAMP
jgi:signal transduction histidine kinase